jgi:uncharacterized protein YcbK (DUF882 family)
MRACSRREFLAIGGGALATFLIPTWGQAAWQPDAGTRSLSFYHTHTGERLSVCYFRNGRYQSGAIERINSLLRDHRTGDIEPIDRRLIDDLYRVKQQLGSDAVFHVISGYRSPQTNSMLRKKSSGVAKFSYHMLGRAIDIRIPGCKTALVRDACIDLQCGGVGYYPRSDFVHLDTGAIRAWRG